MSLWKLSLDLMRQKDRISLAAQTRVFKFGKAKATCSVQQKST